MALEYGIAYYDTLTQEEQTRLARPYAFCFTRPLSWNANLTAVPGGSSMSRFQGLQ